MFDYITYKDKNGKDEIYEFIELLGKKAQTSKNDRIQLKKIFEYLEVLKAKGTWAGEPYVKFIESEQNSTLPSLWELRPTDNRIFFSYWKDNMFVLLHHFRKKTKKTPQNQIEQVNAKLKDWLERNGK